MFLKRVTNSLQKGPIFSKLWRMKLFQISDEKRKLANLWWNCKLRNNFSGSQPSSSQQAQTKPPPMQFKPQDETERRIMEILSNSANMQRGQSTATATTTQSTISTQSPVVSEVSFVMQYVNISSKVISVFCLTVQSISSCYTSISIGIDSVAP